VSFPRLVFAAAVFALALPATAQFSSVPNSGCANARSLTTTGTPQLGMPITYTWFCSACADVPFMLFGPAIPQTFPLPQPIACTANCLLIHPAPPLFVAGPAGQGLNVSVTIPMDPSLVGQSIHTQGACLATTACVYLGVATATRIQ
jgi:hypothetical protein